MTQLAAMMGKSAPGSPLSRENIPDADLTLKQNKALEDYQKMKSDTPEAQAKWRELNDISAEIQARKAGPAAPQK